MLWLYHRTKGIVHVEGSAATEIIGDNFICRSSSGEVIAEYPRLDVIAFTDKPQLLALLEMALSEAPDLEKPDSAAFTRTLNIESARSSPPAQIALPRRRGLKLRFA